MVTTLPERGGPDGRDPSQGRTLRFVLKPFFIFFAASLFPGDEGREEVTCNPAVFLRNGKDNMVPVESYIKQRTNAEFTHGFCSNCRDKYFEEVKKMKKPK
jgi:hypothetical protein